MIVCIEVRKLMDDDILDKLARRTGKLDIVGDETPAPVAASPECLHLAELPLERFEAKTGRPEGVQSAEERTEGFKLGFACGGA